MRKIGSLVLILAVSVLLAACKHSVSMGFDSVSAPPPADAIDAGFRVGSFRDSRGTSERWLGAIRGPVGEPGRRLYTEDPIHMVVESAFRDGLAERSLLAESHSADFEIRGNIEKLDCNQLVRREAHSRIDVAIVSAETRQIVYQKTYRADLTEWTARPWYLGSTDGLRNLAEQALRDTVDQALTDPILLSAITAVEPARPTDSTERLEHLRSLHEHGLITDGEYEEKRQEILRSL